ncbi:toprim domain-containing protein [Pseudomonas sp. PCH199]|uniref:toprim domain-containing protein n=1 Tax=unclassified Pseudomonas TaxID=196821 RepID=UPI000BD74DE3|nr:MULTISPECIES: toprim domain-containing protein [unclassified Pseudomonas]MCW8275960.1 toprim domain-containing protein [Pseudomonas sp. PCH199]PAM84032.1 DNA primase [Pseudomonas sp. ERMR1:02]
MHIKQPAKKRGPAAFGLKKVSAGKPALASIHVEIQRIAGAALPAADNLLADWLPDGTRKGKEYWPTNPVRGDRKPGSFSINLHTGKWNDFASGDKGGDLVSLLAYLRGCSQIEAARILAGQLGLQFGVDHKRDHVDEEVARQRMARQREQRQQQEDEETRAKWEEAAASARRDWALAGPADPNHPYLVRKRIKPHHLRQLGSELLVPICWRGELVSLQRIKSDGIKLFLSGGRISGCYCLFGRIEAGVELFIVEGIATAATLHEQTGKPVVAAMSAGNLLPAGLELKHLQPNAVLVVGGDDDRAKEAEGKPNAGKLAAIHAASMLNCGYVLPAWPEGAPLHLSDFNDLAVWHEVRV